MAKTLEEKRQYQRDWRATNKDRNKVYYDRYNASEHYKQYRKQYRLKNVDEIKERERRYAKENRIRINELSRLNAAKQRAKDPVKARNYLNKWRRENPHVSRYHCNLRRASLIQAMPSWVDKNHIKVIYEMADRIQKCLGIKMHVDHSIPLHNKKVCGLHVPLNLQILPASLNCKKSNRFEV